MRLNHMAGIEMDTETLQADLDKRVAESMGTAVIYSADTVQTLLNKIMTLENLLMTTTSSIKELFTPVDKATVKHKRMAVIEDINRILDKLESEGFPTTHALRKRAAELDDFDL